MKRARWILGASLIMALALWVVLPNVCAASTEGFCQQIRFTNNTGVSATRLGGTVSSSGGVVQWTGISIVTNATGCGAPTVNITQPNTFEIVWPNACVDNGEFVEVGVSISNYNGPITVAADWRDNLGASLGAATQTPMVPTLTTWGLIILASLLSVAGVVILIRRRSSLATA